MFPLHTKPAAALHVAHGAPTLAFMGEPLPLRLAFGGRQRQELSKVARFAEVELTPANWRQYPETTREVDFLLATWNVPKMDAEFLAAFPSLKAVFYAAGSIKYFMTEEAYARGVVVCSAAAANAIPVAEYALSAILLSLKNFWGFTRITKAPWGDPWQPPIDKVLGSYRAVVGLVSLGAVGRAVAGLLSHFDTEVIAYDPLVSEADAAALGVKLVPLEEVFSRANVVSVHTPLIPETVHLVNACLLRTMQPSATFINTSRGAIVNEDDLCRVMRERPDLTAILDVTWPEPPANDSPFFALPNIILTPHIAGSYGNEVTRMGDWMTGEARRFLKQDPLQYQVTQDMLARMA